MATLFLVSTGTQIVAEGKRRSVDPHWFRGISYLRIGWQWVKPTAVFWWAGPTLRSETTIQSAESSLTRPSYLRIGWQWVKSALVNGWQLYKNLVLTGDPDPEPAMASVKPAET